MSKRNIAIVWDFDGTLTKQDSTFEVVKHLDGARADQFWDMIKAIGQKNLKKSDWEHVLASDAPTWMYSLAKIADAKRVPLNQDFFHKLTSKVSLFPGCAEFLKSIKSLEDTSDFKSHSIQIHHFIVSAGMKEYIEVLVPENLFSWIWGCRYSVIIDEKDLKGDNLQNIPVFCMDETMKTRALFEIVKGTFIGVSKEVNDRVEMPNLWCQFENLIYVGDGPTDVPSLSLVRDRGGMGIVVYEPAKSKSKIAERLGKMSADKRCDAIVPADFSLEGELYKTLATRCNQIRQKFAAEDLQKS